MLRGKLRSNSDQKVFKQFGKCLSLVMMQHVAGILKGGNFQILDRFQPFVKLIQCEFTFPPLRQRVIGGFNDQAWRLDSFVNF